MVARKPHVRSVICMKKGRRRRRRSRRRRVRKKEREKREGKREGLGPEPALKSPPALSMAP